MVSTRWPHIGAVLAGGRSRRMGRDKHSIVLPDGRTLLETVIITMEGLCDRVVVCGDVETDRPVVKDLRPDTGPAAGLEALLASGLDTEYLVCPCDVPRITTDVLAMLTHPTSADATVFHVAGEPKFRPLPARVVMTALPTVSAALDGGRRAMWQVLEALEPAIVALDDDARLFNVNTPDDVAALQE